MDKLHAEKKEVETQLTQKIETVGLSEPGHSEHDWKVMESRLKVRLFKSLPNDNILDWSKLKAFADDKIILNEKLEFVLEIIENIVGKGENAG